MHEFITFNSLSDFHLTQFQGIFFIVTFQAFFALQEYILLPLVLGAIFWVTSSYKEWTLYLSCGIAWLLAYIILYKCKCKPLKVSYDHLYYYLVQPTILLLLMPVYVPQTNYPIGVVLAFLVWLAIHIILLLFNATGRSSANFVAWMNLPCVFIFLLCFLFPHTPLLAILLVILSVFAL